MTRRRRSLASLTALSLLAAGVSLPILTLAQPAKAAVTVGTNISVFPNRDMVVAVGYEEGEQLLIEVLRDGVVIGTTQGPAVETPEGIGIEVNHGPLGTPQPGDCWTNFTPNIVGGDVISVTAVDRPGAPVDTMTVQGVDFSGDPVENADGTVSVSGTATPGTDFAVEFRRDKPTPRFRRGPFTPVFEAGTNNWKATFRPTATSAEGLSGAQQRQIALTEASWAAVADNITETTLAELGEPGGVGPGCNGTADPNSLVGGLEPINIASGDVTFSGTTRADVTAVSVTVGALGALDAVLDADANTWTLAVPKTSLSTLPEGNVAVTPRFTTATPDATSTFTGAARNVVKDTSAPEAPIPSIAPGTYSGTQSVVLNKPAGEGTSKVYWEIGNAGVPDPNEFSNLYTGQIAVTSAQTLKGRLIDAAGNPGAVGAFDYKIGTPPAAPSGLTATESTTAAGTANLRWTAAAGATGYNVYLGDVKVNTTVVTGTSFNDSGAGLGDHTYVVRAVEANGIESVDSNAATVTIEAPAVPTGLNATPGNASATLRWTAATGVANYRIYRDNVALPSLVAGSASTYTNPGLTNGTLYEYAIAALDAGGNESARTGVVQAVPAVPTDTTPPPASTVSPASGTYTSARTVTATNTEAGVTHRYTVAAGTTAPADPTVDSPELPAGGLTVSSSSVVKIAAFDAAGNRSVVTRNYTISAATGGTRTVTLNAVADTYVRQNASTTTFGTVATGLKSDTQSITGNASSRDTSYVRFAAPTLAAGETVTGAVLRLNVTNVSSNGPLIYRTAATWAEGITYASGRPTRSSTTAVANIGSVAANGQLDTTVTGVTGAAQSFELFAESSDGFDFTPRESATDPQLILTIGTSATAPTDTTPPPASTVSPASGTYTSARTVTATNTEAGVTHRYTVAAGTTAPADPTVDSPVLPAGGLSVSSSSVVKIAAFDAAGNRSVVTRNYTISAATGGTRTVTLNAVADTYVRQNASTTTFGTVATGLKSDTQSITGNASSRDTSYVRFAAPTLAAGETVTGAVLRLNVTNVSSNGPLIYRTAATWAEGITYASGRPTRSSTTAVANIGSVAANGQLDTTVTGVTGAAQSFELFAESSDGFDFTPRESATDPQLILTIRTP